MIHVKNRTIEPPIEIPQKIGFLKPVRESLGQNSYIHLLEGKGIEVLKIEWVFNAGSSKETNSLVPIATNELIHRGTNDQTARQIAEHIDYYGAFFEHEVTKDRASLVLYCLVKHQEKLIPLVSKVLHSAAFPEKEFETFIANKRQNFLINQEKVSTLARNEFNNLLFGEDHPYNTHLKLSSFDTISRENIKEFYESYYKEGESEIFVSGDFNAQTLTLLSNEFDKNRFGLEKAGRNIPSFEAKSGVYHLEKEGAVQTAIRIGKKGLGRNHPHYGKLKVANTLLGGYFGSRLMSNLREDKGYTYGISSSVVPFLKDGIFAILTEVNAEHAQKAVDEIQRELKVLQQEIPTTEEIDVVRNYMMGAILKSLDGVFSQMEAYKEIYLNDLDYSFYQSYIEDIKTITTDEISEMVRTYLTWEDMIVLTAGKI